MKTIFVFALLFTCHICQAQRVGIFQNQADVGRPALVGSITYEEFKQTYNLSGAGYNIWFARDEFRYAYQKLKGNFIITADFEFTGKGTDPHRKIGWMIRTSLDDNAPHVSAVAHGDGLTVLQWRVKKGMAMRDPEDEIFSTIKGFYTLQLERKGNMVTMYGALKGKPLELIGTTEAVILPEEVLVGIFICSHNPEVLETAQVTNITIDSAPTH